MAVRSDVQHVSGTSLPFLFLFRSLSLRNILARIVLLFGDDTCIAHILCQQMSNIRDKVPLEEEEDQEEEDNADEGAVVHGTEAGSRDDVSPVRTR
jgi:hypothetical protein